MAATSTPASYLIPRCLEKFLADHPNVSVSLKIFGSPDVELAVIEGRCDLGVMVSQPVSTGFIVDDLGTDQLVVVVGCKHPFAGKAEISVSVKNSGTVEGTEIVQLYLRDEVSSVTTPGLALKGFGRVSLKPGESQILHFTVGAEHLALWNREMKHVVEPGTFKIMVGSSSANIRLTDSLQVMP